MYVVLEINGDRGDQTEEDRASSLGLGVIFSWEKVGGTYMCVWVYLGVG